ncbi:MAG: hypothetical protein COU10_04195, partial [Candidatus Harrisonbacteria bacterium CG10_big_fil_rev_8_21_14_0_10_45_28]
MALKPPSAAVLVKTAPWITRATLIVAGLLILGYLIGLAFSSSSEEKPAEAPADTAGANGGGADAPAPSRPKYRYRPPDAPPLPLPAELWDPATKEILISSSSPRYLPGDRVVTLTWENPEVTLDFPAPCWVRIPNNCDWRGNTPVTSSRNLKGIERGGGDPRPIVAHQQRFDTLIWVQPL